MLIQAVLVAVSTCLVPQDPASILQAARSGNLEAVKQIVASDSAMLRVADTVGYSPLHLAAAYARWDILVFLIDAGAEVNSQALDHTTPLHAASVYDEPEFVEMLLARGADSSLAVGDLYGAYTPLLRAAQSGAMHVTALLLRWGADPSAVTKEGWSALHLAALGGHPHLFHTLLAGGVPGDVVDDDGRAYEECLLVRPPEIPIDATQLMEYVGDYGPFLRVFQHEGRIWLDDHTLDALYPIGKDAFFCERNPWEVVFLRNEEGMVVSVELTFLRRSVVVEKT